MEQVSEVLEDMLVDLADRLEDSGRLRLPSISRKMPTRKRRTSLKKRRKKTITKKYKMKRCSALLF